MLFSVCQVLLLNVSDSFVYVCMPLEPFPGMLLCGGHTYISHSEGKLKNRKLY